MKKYVLFGMVAILMVGCSGMPKKVELSQKEIQTMDKNQDAMAGALVRKAVLKEMSEYKYTPEEKKALEQDEENLKVEFYLNTIAQKNVNVTDEQAKAVYDANKEQLKNIKPEVALPQIKQQLYIQQVNAQKVNYINSLVEKYDLNQKLKSYVGETTAETTTTTK